MVGGAAVRRNFDPFVEYRKYRWVLKPAELANSSEKADNLSPIHMEVSTMRLQYLCIAAILPAVLLVDGRLNRPEAQSRIHDKVGNSPIYMMHMNSYRWRLPAFRMAGKSAFVIVRIENRHDYPLEISMDCRTKSGPIPQLTGNYIIKAHEFMRVDTRRFRHPMTRGDGVQVRCKFRADASAKVEAWIYDEDMKRAQRSQSVSDEING